MRLLAVVLFFGFPSLSTAQNRERASSRGSELREIGAALAGRFQSQGRVDDVAFDAALKDLGRIVDGEPWIVDTPDYQAMSEGLRRVFDRRVAPSLGGKFSPDLLRSIQQLGSARPDLALLRTDQRELLREKVVLTAAALIGDERRPEALDAGAVSVDGAEAASRARNGLLAAEAETLKAEDLPRVFSGSAPGFYAEEQDAEFQLFADGRAGFVTRAVDGEKPIEGAGVWSFKDGKLFIEAAAREIGTNRSGKKGVSRAEFVLDFTGLGRAELRSRDFDVPVHSGELRSIWRLRAGPLEPMQSRIEPFGTRLWRWIQMAVSAASGIAGAGAWAAAAYLLPSAALMLAAAGSALAVGAVYLWYWGTGADRDARFIFFPRLEAAVLAVVGWALLALIAGLAVHLAITGTFLGIPVDRRYFVLLPLLWGGGVTALSTDPIVVWGDLKNASYRLILLNLAVSSAFLLFSLLDSSPYWPIGVLGLASLTLLPKASGYIHALDKIRLRVDPYSRGERAFIAGVMALSWALPGLAIGALLVPEWTLFALILAAAALAAGTAVAAGFLMMFKDPDRLSAEGVDVPGEDGRA